MVFFSVSNNLELSFTILEDEVLDIGCGIADNAIYIARHANNVNITSIDMVNSQLFYLFK
jgi:cyclopropane fatty-acyl-phospholipid synthase-like methyltransferase